MKNILRILSSVITVFILTSSNLVNDNPFIKNEYKVISYTNNDGTGSKTDVSKEDYRLYWEQKVLYFFMDENDCSIEYQLEPNNTISVFAGHTCTKNTPYTPLDKIIRKGVLELRNYSVAKDTITLVSTEITMKIVFLPKSVKK
ncbi:MAG: hypothetical protein RLZZ175_2133 [Bacteroidota bacterium]|jgi:hypothetical protein